MTIEFEDFDLTPKEFSLLLHMSVNQLRKNVDRATEYSQAVQDIFVEIEDQIGEQPSKWLRSPLSSDIHLTPLQVWKYRPSLQGLLSCPEEALDDCFPDWRVINFKRD